MTKLRLDGSIEPPRTGSFVLNGKAGEWVRYVAGLLLAAALAYFALAQRVAVAETTEGNHFQEMQRTLGRIEADIREIRQAVGR